MSNPISAKVTEALHTELAADTPDEAGAAYRDGDPEAAGWTRRSRGKSVVYSLRLNPEEVARLEAQAVATGIPASTLARALIINGLSADNATDLRSAIESAVRS